VKLALLDGGGTCLYPDGRISPSQKSDSPFLLMDVSGMDARYAPGARRGTTPRFGATKSTPISAEIVT